MSTPDTTEAEYDDGPLVAPSYFTEKRGGRHCGDPDPCTGRNGCRCGAAVTAAES